jgi:inner membrane transporter RhtA
LKHTALRSALFPLLLLVAAMCAFQLGAVLSKSLFPLVGPRGTAVLRLTIAALILMGTFRAWRARLARHGWLQVARYGAVLGMMNLCFYLALQRLPLGVVVTLEFIGPLSVALWHSRSALHFLWAGLAVSGLLLLVPWRGAGAVHAVDPVGVLFALGAALSWGLYIVFLPLGAAAALPAFTAPTMLGIALAVAVLSSVLPYSLEMMALTKLSPRVFGVSMSLEPAIAALAGWLILDEVLAPLQCLAIAAIIIASGGATLSAQNS